MTPFKGPMFITGEPRRDYTFLFRLSTPDITLKYTPSWTRILFSDLFLTYISGLAEKVTLPSEKFEVAPVQFSLLQVPFPKGFSISNLSVQYLEDELESVFKFHYIWQNNIRGNVVSGKTLDYIGGGLQFAELGKVCCKAVYAPSKKLSLSSVRLGGLANVEGFNSILAALPTEVPLGGEVFPHIFPVQIDRAPGDRSGSNIAKTTVTYARIIKIDNGTSSEWSYAGDKGRGTSYYATKHYTSSYDAVRVTTYS